MEQITSFTTWLGDNAGLMIYFSEQVRPLPRFLNDNERPYYIIKEIECRRYCLRSIRTRKYTSKGNRIYQVTLMAQALVSPFLVLHN
jgi:hypothetical protein